MMESLAHFMADRKKKTSRRMATHKGNAFEDEIAELFKAAGFCVEVTKLNRSFSRGRWFTKKGDFFTSIDIIALRPSKSPVFLIQATTDRGIVARKKKKIDETIGGWSEGRELLVVTRAADGKRFEVHRQTPGGWAPAFDAEGLDIGWGMS